MRDWFDEFRRLEDDMRRMMDRLFNMRDDLFYLDALPSKSKKKTLLESNIYEGYREPLVDVIDNGKEIIATIELPGVDKKDIELNIDEEGIEVKVETNENLEMKDKKHGVYRLERNYLGFYRKIPLPEDVDPDKAKASYKNGILEIRVPKKKDSKKKRINIE